MAIMLCETGPEDGGKKPGVATGSPWREAGGLIGAL